MSDVSFHNHNDFQMMTIKLIDEMTKRLRN